MRFCRGGVNSICHIGGLFEKIVEEGYIGCFHGFLECTFIGLGIYALIFLLYACFCDIIVSYEIIVS